MCKRENNENRTPREIDEQLFAAVLIRVGQVVFGFWDRLKLALYVSTSDKCQRRAVKVVSSSLLCGSCRSDGWNPRRVTMSIFAVCRASSRVRCGWRQNKRRSSEKVRDFNEQKMRKKQITTLAIERRSALPSAVYLQAHLRLSDRRRQRRT